MNPATHEYRGPPNEKLSITAGLELGRLARL
jgi:hypothetical protein